MAHARPLLVLACVAALSLGCPAAAQDGYPAKPIRLVVPFPPGGVVDILARLVGPRMGEGLGQGIVIDNRAGANGNIATELVARSQPDGYTLLLGQITNLAINPALYRNIPFDPVKDLAPVGLVASAPQLMVVSTGSGFRSVADVMAAARARPEEVTFASSGNGSLAHLGQELMSQQAGVRFLHVPYKGAAPAVIDVVGGRAEVFMAAVPSVLGQVRGGKLRMLAVTSATRHPDLPEVPTLAESGFPGYDASNWFAIMGRAGTPGAIVARLNAELNRTLAAPDIRAKIAHEGARPLGGTPQQLADVLAADLAKWRKVVADSGAKAD